MMFCVFLNECLLFAPFFTQIPLSLLCRPALSGYLGWGVWPTIKRTGLEQGQWVPDSDQQCSSLLRAAWNHSGLGMIGLWCVLKETWNRPGDCFSHTYSMRLSFMKPWNWAFRGWKEKEGREQTIPQTRQRLRMQRIPAETPHQPAVVPAFQVLSTIIFTYSLP